MTLAPIKQKCRKCGRTKEDLLSPCTCGYDDGRWTRKEYYLRKVEREKKNKLKKKLKEKMKDAKQNQS